MSIYHRAKPMIDPIFIRFVNCFLIKRIQSVLSPAAFAAGCETFWICRKQILYGIFLRALSGASFACANAKQKYERERRCGQAVLRCMAARSFPPSRPVAPGPFAVRRVAAGWIFIPYLRKKTNAASRQRMRRSGMKREHGCPVSPL